MFVLFSVFISICAVRGKMNVIGGVVYVGRRREIRDLEGYEGIKSIMMIMMMIVIVLLIRWHIHVAPAICFSDPPTPRRPSGFVF